MHVSYVIVHINKLTIFIEQWVDKHDYAMGATVDAFFTVVVLFGDSLIYLKPVFELDM